MPKIPASERDAFYESRRTHLAEVALKLWAERGFDQTSVATICEEAGVAKGTFYLYFESKEALLTDVLRRNSLLPNVQELVENLREESLEDAVHGFVRGAWQHLAGHRDLLIVVLGELPTHLDEARVLVEHVMVPANQLLAEYLESRLPAGRADEISLVIAARGLIGMILTTFITQEILGAGRVLPVPEEQITRTLADTFLSGITRPTSTEAPSCSDTSGSTD